jgi:quercetin dioxygenase-like cupin family protein
VVGDYRRLEVDEPYPGVTRRSFSTARATVTLYEFLPAAKFPLHRHPQEQITMIQRGDVTFTVGDEPQKLEAGNWSVVPPDVVHSLQAGEDGAEVLAIASPPRENASSYTVLDVNGAT